MVVAAILAIIFSNSCSNEFELIEEWTDIPVAFGLLSRADTAHYIRVEKAFVDPNTSALEIAQIPDSLYYESIGVSVEEISTGTVYQLERVDGNLEGYPREEGIFATAPNYLYKFKLPLNEELTPGRTYELKLTRGDNLPEVTAQTTVVSDMTVAAPSTTLRFEAGRSTSFRWNAPGGNAIFFDLSLRLNYLENSVDEPSVFTDKSMFWPLAKNIDRDDNNETLGEFSLADGNDFFRFIALTLSQQPGSQGLLRDFKNVDIVVTGGDQNLFDYINIGQANTGITSSQVIPNFTNLSEGFGIFGSTNRSIKEAVTLTSATEDSLRNGQFTSIYNFQ